MSLRRGLPRGLARVAALALLAAAPACATVSRAQEAQDPASAVPGERTPTAAELGLPEKGAVPLDVVVRAALRIHPAVVQARWAAEAAAARCRQAEADRLPQVSVNAALVYKDQKSTGGPIEHRFGSYGFDVSWLLFDFGRTSAVVRNAGEEWLAAQQDARTQEVTTAFGARSAYFTLAKQIQLLAAVQETVRSLEAHLDQVRELVRVGKRIPYDQTKAEVDVGNARLAEVQARDAILAAQAALAASIGIAQVIDWSPAPDAPVPPPPKDFDAAWALARTHQPAFAAAAARERAASALVDARVAELYPSLSLGAGYSAAGSSTPLPWIWQIGPQVQWTPFDGFRNLATIDEAVASLRAARAARTLVEQTAWADLRTAWVAIADAKERVKITALTVESAQENLTLSQGRFDAGLGTSIELTDAERALVQARADEIQARADLSISTSGLARAMGIAVVEQ